MKRIKNGRKARMDCRALDEGLRAVGGGNSAAVNVDRGASNPLGANVNNALITGVTVPK